MTIFMYNRDMKAITVKEITGACISTIPIGTEFEIVCILEKYKYATCKRLPITLIWNDEYILLKTCQVRG